MYQNSAKRNIVDAQENLISTVLYTTEASESSEISEKEINIPDPPEEVLAEVFQFNDTMIHSESGGAF